jgi:hypothetical protein
MEDKTIGLGVQAEIIDSVTEALRDHYIFPDVASKMEKYVRDQHRKKAYADVTSTRAFAERLTEDLRHISNDRHIGVRYLTDENLALILSDTSGAAALQKDLKDARSHNFGFRELKLLPGNVGYLRLDGFSGYNEAGATAVAAMNFLANANAIIFDLRQNGGGSPKMIQLLTSYFFDEPIHLNSFYIRKSDSIEQFWTMPHIQGPRLTDVDVYVLTSRRTFSGAEEFSYNLKNLKRGTIVGDTTGGGAHPVEGHFWANLNLEMSVPFGRAINPISGTNWEGTGVIPDIAVTPDKAVDVAHKAALDKLLDRAGDENERFSIEWAIKNLDARLNPPAIDVSSLAHYAGAYGPRSIKCESDALYYRRGQNPWAKMTPMSANLFRFDEFEYFRLEVITDEAGKATEIVGHYDNGNVDKSPRSAD